MHVKSQQLAGIFLAAMFVGVTAEIARSQSSGSPDDVRIARGQEIAERICWACHVVGGNQRFSPILRDRGPDFSGIARRKDVTSESIEAFLRSTHRVEGKPYVMPSPMLTDQMIREVTAYILSLRPKS
jgi:mono/diheme cytochrome c family protein